MNKKGNKKKNGFSKRYIRKPETVSCMHRQIDFEHHPKKVYIMEAFCFPTIKHGPIFPGFSPTSGTNGKANNMQHLRE